MDSPPSNKEATEEERKEQESSVTSTKVKPGYSIKHLVRNWLPQSSALNMLALNTQYDF